mgnify:FL=1
MGRRVGVCTECGETTEIIGRGRCKSCYARARRRPDWAHRTPVDYKERSRKAAETRWGTRRLQAVGAVLEDDAIAAELEALAAMDFRDLSGQIKWLIRREYQSRVGR